MTGADHVIISSSWRGGGAIMTGIGTVDAFHKPVMYDVLADGLRHWLS